MFYLYILCFISVSPFVLVNQVPAPERTVRLTLVIVVPLLLTWYSAYGLWVIREGIILSRNKKSERLQKLPGAGLKQAKASSFYTAQLE